MTIEAEGNEIVVEDTTAVETNNAGQPADVDQTADEPEDDVIVTIGDAPSPQADEDDEATPPWVKEVRRQNRALAKEVREKDRQIEALSKPALPAVPTLGPKPTMRDDDVDFDEDKYDAKVAAWNKAKAKADEAQAAAKADADKDHAAWQAKNKQFTEDAAKLKAPDFEDALDAVKSNIDVVRQTVLLKAAAQPHLVVLALGRQPEELKKLAAIKDPIEFAVAVSKLEGQIKVSSRKPPTPESVPTSAGRAPGGVDKKLEALERKAAENGDYTQVIAYEKQKRAQGQQRK